MPPSSNQRNPLAAYMTPAAPGTAMPEARRLPLALIDPNPQQPRQVFDEGALQELAQSIAAHGVLEPILVRPSSDGRYQVIAGERRTRAARLAGQTDIPAIMRSDLDERGAAILATLENLQREDLDIEDEARQYGYLLEVTGLSGAALAAQLGKSAGYVNKRLQFLQHPYLFEQIRSGQLTVNQALDHIAAQNQRSESANIYDAGGAIATRAQLLAEDSNEHRPHLLERAALDPASGPAPVLVPYRRRAVDNAVNVLFRLDWRTVPQGERRTIREQIELLERSLAEAKEALARDDDV